MKSESRKSLARQSLPRRSFLKTVLMAGASAPLVPQLIFSQAGKAAPSERINVACIGIGNRPGDVIAEFAKTGLANFVGFCDVDMGARQTLKTLKAFPDVPRFQSAEKMFDKLGSQIDAVIVGTPDFSHFPNVMQAMMLGKHVYVEKPMAHTFREVELLMAAEKKFKLACQMGNQGHSEASYFQFKAWTEAGIIKNVTRITAFMNWKRRWHGMKVDGALAKQEVPATLDWDQWLASAPQHEFNKGYINGEWRSWFEFGNGALGDWGAHIFDTPHEFLQLGLPMEVNPVKLEGWSPWIFPQASTLSFKFAARGSQPPVELMWYDGQNNFPSLPENLGEVPADPNVPPPSNVIASSGGKAPPVGKVIYSEELTFKGGSHAATLRVVPEEKEKDLKLPEVPASPSNHYKNFLLAVKGQEKCRSSFAVAGSLCQTMALGVIAQRVNAKLEFDPVAKKITNHQVANELLAGPPPRKGWEQFYKV